MANFFPRVSVMGEFPWGYLVVKKWAQKMSLTPEPRPLKKGTFDTNTVINSEGSGDMASTQYNQI